MPQELIFSIRDITLSAYEPAIYLVSSIHATEDNIWEEQQQTFVLEHHGESNFTGILSLYVLTIPWDQSTLPPLGKVVDTAQVHLTNGKHASFTLDTPILDSHSDIYTLLYAQGEGSLQGDLLLYPTVWADPNASDQWNYEIQSFRY